MSVSYVQQPYRLVHFHTKFQPIDYDSCKTPTNTFIRIPQLKKPTMKKIELKVNIQCQRCKTEVLKAVAKLSGIDQMSVDGEKGVLTVIGDADPVLVTTKVRSTGKHAEIISFGPPEKPETPKPPPEEPLPPRCSQCQLVAVSFLPYKSGPCSIL